MYYYIMDCIIDHLLYTLYGQEGLVGGGGLVTMMDHCAKYPPSVSTSNTLPGHTATVTTAAGIDTCLQNISMWNIACSFACIHHVPSLVKELKLQIII